ncbi:hypothetical protein FO519_000443 [Halicephalobus sp. NKZ332]|nr:hypothetical protein FO519_000443 [Halicephalobus sp. NKZ332]
MSGAAAAAKTELQLIKIYFESTGLTQILEEEQIPIFNKNAYFLWAQIHAIWLTHLQGGFSANRMCYVDRSYVDINEESIEKVYLSVPGLKNIDTLVRLTMPMYFEFRNLVRIIQRYRIDHVEFMVLCHISFMNLVTSVLQLNKKQKIQLYNCHKKLLSDLHKYHTQHYLGEEAVRFGNMTLIIEAVHQASRFVKEQVALLSLSGYRTTVDKENRTATSDIPAYYKTGYWMPLMTIHQLSDLIAGSVSIVLNSILIYLIIMRTTRELRIYSRILIQNAVIDLVFTIITMITQAQIDFDKGVILMMMAGPFRHSPNPVAFHLINVWIIGLFSCVMFLPIPFIYRYFAVCKNYVLSRIQYLLLLFLAFMISFLYTCLHAWAFWPSGNESKFTYMIDHDFWKDSAGRLPVFVASDIKEGRIIILVSCTMMMGGTSYFLVILFNMLIYRKLAKMRGTMSSKTREVHRQLSNVLKWQALVPFVICVTPLTFVFVLCALGVRTAGKGIILTLLVTWIPVMNPLSAIIFVKQYRKVFTRTVIVKLICPGRFARDTATTQAGSSSVGPGPRSIFSRFRDSRIGVSADINSDAYVVSSTQQNFTRETLPSPA